MTELQLPSRFIETQVRSAELIDADEEGIIRMRAVPYDVETQLDRDLWESFAPKSLERSANAPSRVKLRLEHGGPLVGCGREIEDLRDGLYMTARFAATANGAEARELTMSGIVDEVSVEFRALRDWCKITRGNDGLHVRHHRAHLVAVALVAAGQYAQGAKVLSVRDAEQANENKLREQKLALLKSLSR